jgi:hypothetical protein
MSSLRTFTTGMGLTVGASGGVEMAQGRGLWQYGIKANNMRCECDYFAFEPVSSAAVPVVCNICIPALAREKIF